MSIDSYVETDVDHRTPADHSPARNIQSVVDALCIAIGRATLLDDPALVPLVYSPQRAVDAVRRDSIMNRCASHDVTESLLSQSISTAHDLVYTRSDPALGMEARACMPVRDLAGTLVGYLWVLDPNHDLTDVAVQRIRRAAREIAGLMEMSPLNTGANEAKLVECLRSSDAATRQRAAREALQRNLLPGGDVVLCLIASRLPDADATGAARGAVGRLSMGYAIAASTRDGAALIASAEDPLLRRHPEGGLGGWLCSTLADDFVIGQSGTVRLTELDEAARQAAIALRVAHGPFGQPVFADWGAMGADRLLGQLPPLAEADIPAPLARLIQEEPQLAETLAVFLDEAGQIKSTAERLSLHRSGLYYRLARIESLTGLELDRGEDRLLAHLATTLARI